MCSKWNKDHQYIDTSLSVACESCGLNALQHLHLFSDTSSMQQAVELQKYCNRCIPLLFEACFNTHKHTVFLVWLFTF